MPLVWRELFTRAASAEGGASKQLAPQRWPHPGRIIFSKTINALSGDIKRIPVATRRRMRAFRAEILVMTRGIQGAKLEVVYPITRLSYLERYFPNVLSLIVEVKVYGIDRGE